MISTVVALIRHRAETTPEKLAYSFLVDGEHRRISLSYGQLDSEARRIATAIGDRIAPGSRVALIYPHGLEFLTTFFGCLFAGVIGVPVYPPASTRLGGMARLQHIVSNAGCEAILSTSTLSRLSEIQRHFSHLEFILTDRTADGDPSLWIDTGITSDSIAFLQYTSGSTSHPRGVIVRHRHLMANLKSMHWFLKEPCDGSMISWLPMYHDMGLIGTAMYPLWHGIPCYLLSPFSFLQQPLRWLQLISDVRGTISGGPNFAYDLCVDRIAEEDFGLLDLSSWEVAFNGAEPIRAKTVRRFESYFAPVGFRAGTLVGCYGLAESTLIATGARERLRPTLWLDRTEMAHGKVVEVDSHEPGCVELVSCGQAPPDQEVRIVDPTTHLDQGSDQFGEIWLHGPCTASGYWNDPERSAETFAAAIVATKDEERTYLRTGDVGMLHGSELFVTGRMKDVLIVRGRNIHPQDVEEAVQQCDPRIRGRRGVAFAVETQDGEGVALVQETTLRDQQELAELAQSARDKVFQQLQVLLSVIYFVPTRSVLMTSSGKPRRQSTREALLRGEVTLLLENRVLNPVGEHSLTI